MAADQSKLTLSGVADGTTTITVTAQDSDGNAVSDTFDVEVAKRFASLIAQMWEWRNDPAHTGNTAHTDRWDRVLLALGETVADASLSPCRPRRPRATPIGAGPAGWTWQPR